MTYGNDPNWKYKRDNFRTLPITNLSIHVHFCCNDFFIQFMHEWGLDDIMFFLCHSWRIFPLLSLYVYTCTSFIWGVTEAVINLDNIRARRNTNIVDDKVVARNITILNEEKLINHMHSGLQFIFFSLIFNNLRSING